MFFKFTGKLLGLVVGFTLAGAAEPAMGTLRVMSFNIRNSSAHDTTNAWIHRRAAFFRTITEFNPDLIGFQEVLADQHDDIAAALPGYSLSGVARDDGQRKGEWALIGYRSDRFTLVESGDFWLSETPEIPGSKGWGAGYPRICSWSRLRDRASGQVMVYANTHLDNKSKTARAHAAELIVARLSGVAKGQPVVLTGDFNANEDDAAYRVMREAPAAGRLSFVDSYREVHPERTADEVTYQGFKPITAGSRIDFIWHTAAFHAVAAEIDRAHIEGKVFPSDHYAVTAILAPSSQ